MSMQRVMLRSKLHRVTVTQADLHYEGSCGIDADLLEAADIHVHEQVAVVDVDNGERIPLWAELDAKAAGAACACCEDRNLAIARTEVDEVIAARHFTHLQQAFDHGFLAR